MHSHPVAEIVLAMVSDEVLKVNEAMVLLRAVKAIVMAAHHLAETVKVDVVARVDDLAKAAAVGKAVVAEKVDATEEASGLRRIQS